MERKVYLVDEKLFNLLLEEDFNKLNTDELQRLFDNSSYEISDKWVFMSDRTEGEYQKEAENYNIRYFFHFQSLYGYKYFSLIDYGDDSNYKVGIPDVSKFDDGMDRQKCVIIQLLQGRKSEDILNVKKYIFNRLASGTQINNYLISNVKQILVKSFTDFFHDEFDKIQSRVERVKETNNLTEDKNHPFFITYNVDPKQFQKHKHLIAEKLLVLKDIIDVNIKGVFFKRYTTQNIIALIDMEIKTMDLIRTINEYMRADASLYLGWERDIIYYNHFDSQILSEYKQEEADKENIKNIEQIISSELMDFTDNWYDNEFLILSSKGSFYFRSRQLIDKIYNALRGIVSFIYNGVLKLSFRKLRERYNRIRSYIKRNVWTHIGISYTFLAIATGAFQVLFSSSTFKTWFQSLLSNLAVVVVWFQALFSKIFR